MRRLCAILYDAAADAEVPDPSLDVRPAVRDVAAALGAVGWRVERRPLPSPPDRTLQRLCDLAPALVFNLCEGLGGVAIREAAVARRLERLGLPFTGNSSRALLLCLRKPAASAALRAAGIRTPRGVAVRRGHRLPSRFPPFPLIVKPAAEDASVGIDAGSVVRTRAALRDRLARVLRRGSALVEPFVGGREFNAALLGDRVLPISEIEFSGLPVVTWEAKWAPGSADDLGSRAVCPARIPAPLRRRIESLARRVGRTLGLRDYARIDLRMDVRGRLHVLEANPNPDLSRGAGFARAAAAAGIGHAALVRRIAALALERNGIHDRPGHGSHSKTGALARAGA